MVSFLVRRRISLLLSLCALASGPSAFAGKEFLAGPHDQVAPDQLLVGLKPGADIRQILSTIAPQAAAIALSHNQNIYLLKLPPGFQAAVSTLLAAHPLVKYVEPNRIRSTSVGPPNDTNFTLQWNLATVQAIQAWNYFPNQYLTSATPSTNRVKVAILDTGIDCTHPDFINAGGTSTDSAQGGQILWASSVAIQQSTITSPTCGTTTNWTDDYGHGTHVAGILAAAANNATGVAGLGFPLQLIIIKTSGASGSAGDFQVSEGIYDAIDAGAQVISMSLGGAGYSQTLQTAMDAAWQSNVLVIAAAGNLGTSELVYPGDGNHVLAVAATDITNAVASSFSSYGNWVKIAAPGVNILSTLPTYSGPTLCCNYGVEEGTSMATPHVSALAGLLYAANPGISAAAVAQRIQQTAQSPNSGWNQYIGYGVINAAAALENMPAPFTQGALTGQIVEPWGTPITGATVSAGTQSYTTAVDPISGEDNGLFRINLPPGTYPVTVTATGHNTVSTQAVVVAGADTMLTIDVDVPYGEFTGTVTYNGVAVAGAVVEAISSNLIQGTAITNSFGNYTLSLQPGTYTLTVLEPGYLNTPSGTQSLSIGDVTVNLALTALGNITGTVTDLNGIPVPNANVEFASATFSGGCTTGTNGTYNTAGLAAGTYTVTASASGYSNVSVANVNVANNTSTPLNLQFSTGVALTNGLIAYWPFNEGSGTVAFDQSGNGYNANLKNTTWTPGLLFPSALTFNVNESYAVTPASIPFNAASFSASVWVNSTPTEDSWAGLVQSYSPPTFYLGLDSTGTKYKFSVNGGAGSTGTCTFNNIPCGCAQGGAISTGWHLVAATYDGSNAILYLDTAMVASDTFTSNTGSTALQMGMNWGGAMQSMRIYDRALTAHEVSALYNQDSPAALNLSKTADAATVAAGSSIGFTLTASNSGAGTAQGAALSDPLPTGTGIVWTISPAYSGPGTCGIAGGTLTCSFGGLSSGGSASVHIASSTTTSSCGVYSNTATASASNASSVQASATTTVQCGQTINFGPLPNQPYGTVPFNVSASATSNLAVSFNSQTTSVCTVSGSTVTLVTGGTCTIQATQPGNAIYTAATSVDQSFTVTPESQTITFAPLPNEPYGTAPFNVGATATSNLPVILNSQTPAVCTVVSPTVTLVAVGTCTIQATQAGNADWSAAPSVNQSFSITQGTQTINFGPLQNQAFRSGTINLTASATSTLAVSFNSQTTSTCTVLNSTVTLVAVGTCTIQATQSGNTNWSAAPSVNQSFSITQGTQTINFGPLQNQAFGSGTVNLTAPATSTLPVSFNSQTTSTCTVSNATVTLVAVGTCTIQATQSGSTNWSAAPSVNQSFSITQATQTINFGAIPSLSLATAPFALNATSSSGLTVSLSSQTKSVCTVSDVTVTLLAVGTCSILAAQPGNTNYSAAPFVNQSFTVTAGIGAAGVNSINFPNTIVGSSSATQTFNFQNSGNTALTITSIAPAGADAANYRYTADGVHPCPISPATLSVGASCTLDVTFAPVSQGSHNNAQIAIIDNSGNVPGTTQPIGLTGTGVVLSSISIGAISASLGYGSSEQFTATGTYSDNSTAGLTSQVTWASSAQNVAGINASGIATALSAGQTNITATLSGVNSNAFQLNVVAATAASISVSAGSGQSATVGTAFAATLQALVKDSAGDVLPNALVTFTAPSTGAGGTFANGLTTYNTTTNSSGVATSLIFTANSTAGSYSLTAGAAGVANPASFSLTNLKAPVLTVTQSPSSTFVQGQSASYTITVANASNAGPTSGPITVTESLSSGLTLTALTGGPTWTCNVTNSSCTTNSVLTPGSSSFISVAVSVGYNTQGSLSSGAAVTGGSSQASTGSDPTPVISACAVTLDSTPSVADLQQIVNEALGIVAPANDLDGDGAVNVIDLEIVTNAVLGGACKAS